MKLIKNLKCRILWCISLLMMNVLFVSAQDCNKLTYKKVFLNKLFDNSIIKSAGTQTVYDIGGILGIPEYDDVSMTMTTSGLQGQTIQESGVIHNLLRPGKTTTTVFSFSKSIPGVLINVEPGMLEGEKVYFRGSPEGKVSAESGGNGLIKTINYVVNKWNWNGGAFVNYYIIGNKIEYFVENATSITYNNALDSRSIENSGSDYELRLAIPNCATVLINEIDTEQSTYYNNKKEFIELYDGGVGNTSLYGYVVVLYDGSSNKSYNAINLDGYHTNAKGYFVIGSDAVPNVDLVAFTTDGIQNGPDAIALYRDTPINFSVDTPVTTTNLIDAIIYGTGGPDAIGLLPLLNSDQPYAFQHGQSISDPGHALQRIPNGSGGARNTTTYYQATPTPGFSNDEYYARKATTNELIKKVTPVSTLKVQKVPEIVLYPNPSSGIFKIDLNNFSNPKEDIYIEVYKYNGQKVYTEQLNLEQLKNKKFNLSSLGSGLYIIKVQRGKDVTSKRIIIRV